MQTLTYVKVDFTFPETKKSLFHFHSQKGLGEGGGHKLLSLPSLQLGPFHPRGHLHLFGLMHWPLFVQPCSQSAETKFPQYCFEMKVAGLTNSFQIRTSVRFLLCDALDVTNHTLLDMWHQQYSVKKKTGVVLTSVMLALHSVKNTWKDAERLGIENVRCIGRII